MGISYSNVLLLREERTMHDLERCSVCPYEVAEGKPSIGVTDNDDFHNDTLNLNLVKLKHLIQTNHYYITDLIFLFVRQVLLCRSVHNFAT